MAHRNRHGITLQVYGTGQFPGLGRGLECACIVASGGVHIAVAGMKPLKILVNHFHQLRGYLVLAVVHCFLLSSFVWLVGALREGCRTRTNDRMGAHTPVRRRWRVEVSKAASRFGSTFLTSVIIGRARSFPQNAAAVGIRAKCITDRSLHLRAIEPLRRRPSEGRKVVPRGLRMPSMTGLRKGQRSHADRMVSEFASLRLDKLIGCVERVEGVDARFEMHFSRTPLFGEG